VRWTEEVDLLVEEMRCALAFFEWKVAWWRSQADRHFEEEDSIYHEVKAYAEKQAVLLERLAQCHAKHWLPTLYKHGISQSWMAKYEDVLTTDGGMVVEMLGWMLVLMTRMKVVIQRTY
jgi:hypothetical protein